MAFEAPVRIDLSYATCGYFDQASSDAVGELLGRYAGYRPELLDRIQFVVVDDGSPVPVRIPPELDLNVLLLAVVRERSWNQVAARNLSVLYSRSDRVLCTDIDLEYDEATLSHLVEMRLPRRNLYLIPWRQPDGSIKRYHPSACVMSRGRYLELFGSDEEFAGRYGAEDRFLREWQKLHGTRIKQLPERFACQDRHIDRDADYHSLERRGSANEALRQRKREEIAEWGPRGGHSRAFLTSRWEVVEDRRRRQTAWAPPRDRSWQRLWRLRRWLPGA